MHTEVKPARGDIKITAKRYSLLKKSCLIVGDIKTTTQPYAQEEKTDRVCVELHNLTHISKTRPTEVGGKCSFLQHF